MKRQRQRQPPPHPATAIGTLGGFLLLTSGFCSARVLQQNASVTAESEGFLSNELPLEILVTTPSELADNSTRRLRVEDQQALTVVFSRSVIALGQDFGVTSLPDDKVPFFLEPEIPGRFRWVTTYIARWDPDESWLLDYEVKFSLNENLKTHDGILFQSEGNAGSVILTTPSLSMDIESVESEKAANLTDDGWDATVGLESDILPEVPPDGVIRLAFNTKVSLTALQENLKVLDDSSKKPAKGLVVNVQPCDPESDGFISPKPCLRCKVPMTGSEKSDEENYCVEVSIDGDLQMETRYALFLAKGVEYSKKAGALKAEKKVTFGGLRRFRIPFFNTTDGIIGTNFLRMRLPHGLEKNTESDIQALKKQFTILTEGGDEVDFELELESNSTLRISTSFTPETNYTISVDGSRKILDGYGLSLESSSIKIFAKKIDGVLEPFRMEKGYAIFEAGEDWGQKIVTAFKGNPDFTCPDIESTTLSIFPISGSKHIKTISDILALYSVDPDPLTNDLGNPIEKLQQENEDSTELVEFDIKKYLNSTGLVAAEFCILQMLINESDMQALILGSGDGQSIVWVTSMKTGKPVQGAKVTLLIDEKNEVSKLSTNVTDAEGKAFFFDGLLFADFAHVEYKKKSFFVRRVYSGYDDLLEEISASLVLDRRLVKPGETLHIKGYSRGPALTESAKITMYPAFDPETSEEPSFPVDIDEKFGTFDLKIPVPKNATNTEYYVSLFENVTLDQEGFTVGNPRPPDCGCPLLAKPDSKVEIKITAESFIGAAVGDAKITLKWSIPGDDTSNDKPLEGEVELITDSLGKLSTEIDLGALEKTPSTDTSLEIEVSWVGLTRQLLEESASVLLRQADVEIEFDRSIGTDFPGQEFGVKVSQTNLEGKALKNRTLVLDLKQISNPESDLPSKNSQPLDEAIVDSCKIQSNSKGYDCRFSIPDLGLFVLETCIVIDTDSGEQFCKILKMGKTAEMWKEDGLVQEHLRMELVRLTEGPHKVGDQVKFGIENPYQNVKALVMWGSRSGVNHKIMPINDSSLHEFSIDLGENCAKGCRLSVGVMVPRQTEGIALNPNRVPVSKLFDLAMPHSTELTSKIYIRTDLPLDVEITFPDVEEDEDDDFVISPGEKTTIQVNIADPEIDEAEVTVIAVDKAILELLPYALKDLTGALEFTDILDFGFSSSGADLVSPRAIEILIQDFMHKKEIDPWFDPVSELDPDYYSSVVDKTEKEYVDSRSKFVTVNEGSEYDELDYDYESEESYGISFRSAYESFGGGGGGGGGGRGGGGGGGGSRAFASSASVASENGRSGAASASSAAPPPSGSVRVLEDFVSTALFETVIAKGGIATVNFTAPDNLGTFNIRSYVATANEKYGIVERELIVRRAISLTPSAPRFARVGDAFEAGAVVTVSGINPSKTNVSVSIDLLEGACLEIVGKSERIVKLGEDGTEEVRFRFKAKKMGEAKFKISAEIEGQGASDALVINFPVEGLQDAVTVATSFAINGNSTSQWQEGLQLPQSVPGSGAIAIQAGVGRLPAVLSMANQLYESNPDYQCPMDATFALAVVAIPFVTETYKVLDLDPASLDGNTLEVTNGIRSNFTSGLESLQEMTRDEIGLDYVLNCKKYPRTFPTRPSLTMNARGVFLLRLLKDDLDTLEREVVKNGIPPLESLNEGWTSALETALLDEAKSSRKNKRAIYIASLALARAALGGDWVPPPETSKQMVKDLSMDRLSEEFDSMDVESQTYCILTRVLMDGEKNHSDIQKAIKSWTSNFRVTGRTAYIARSEGSSTPASNIANSLALMVMLKAKVENSLLGKLANFVSSPPVSQYGFRVFSDFDKAVAMVALRNYDVDRGSDQPDLKLEVRSGEPNLLDVQVSGNANPLASSSTPWEALASPLEPLEFRADGIGEVTLAAALTFVPAEILRFPTYRGIFVQRSISIADSENKVCLKTIPVTSVVEVSVQFTTPDRLGPTTVRVLMPAGLEPVDPNIDGPGNTCPVPLASWGGSFFTCPDQETEPSVVTFRFNSVNAGTQTVNFRAVAATAGTFTLPPVKTFVNEQPEVMGLSPASELEICSGKNCVAVEDAPSETPKSCPNDCSDNGACDLDSGVCLCLKGFRGKDCGKLEVA
ncbi:hypothetical protein BSKO_12549 [Bryopsis sp. KO-2023]|nr:hypothetical protein BSKO_12549 [Bryopsis sp. KO-2023]